jgi:hypothetical protein
MCMRFSNGIEYHTINAWISTLSDKCKLISKIVWDWRDWGAEYVSVQFTVDAIVFHKDY